MAMLLGLRMGFVVGVALLGPLLPPVPQAQAQAQIGPAAAPMHGAQAVDMTVLEAHLAAQNWSAADAETRRILDPWIHPGGNIVTTPLATNLPPEVLQALDRLWVEASDGRFGFGVQQQIWAEELARSPMDSRAATQAFGQRVGWTRPAGMADPTLIAGEWLTEMELTHSLAAPRGHLPWVGVSWADISRLLSVQSCGSCTIDAMFVQGERFYQYLPLFYDWVDTALEQGPERGCRLKAANHVLVGDAIQPNSSIGGEGALVVHSLEVVDSIPRVGMAAEELGWVAPLAF